MKPTSIYQKSFKGSFETCYAFIGKDGKVLRISCECEGGEAYKGLTHAKRDWTLNGTPLHSEDICYHAKELKLAIANNNLKGWTDVSPK